MGEERQGEIETEKKKKSVQKVRWSGPERVRIGVKEKDEGIREGRGISNGKEKKLEGKSWKDDDGRGRNRRDEEKK